MSPSAGTYDLAFWFEGGPINAAEARSAYLDLATPGRPTARPDLITAFADRLLASFTDVEPGALPDVPGSRNARLGSIDGECYVFDAGVYLTFPVVEAPDLTPFVCRIADEIGLVVYDRQRQGVFLPSSIEARWDLRATVGDGFVVAHDPTPLELPALLDAADQSNWFLILERDADHYVQTAPDADSPSPAGRTWFVEFRDGPDGEQHQAAGATLDQVKQVFVLYAMGTTTWRDLCTWEVLA